MFIRAILSEIEQWPGPLSFTGLIEFIFYEDDSDDPRGPEDEDDEKR